MHRVINIVTVYTECITTTYLLFYSFTELHTEFENLNLEKDKLKSSTSMMIGTINFFSRDAQQFVQKDEFAKLECLQCFKVL